MNITKLVFLFLLLMSNGKVYSQDYTSGFDSNSPVFECLEFSKNDIAWSEMGNKLLPYRIIALGEPTHGSAEFATLRLSLTKQLILSKALTKIGLEIGFNNSDALNEYVNGQRSDIKEILKTLNFWPSRSVEFIEFLNWVKEYNYTKKPAEKIRLFGFDCTTRGNTNSKILSSIHSLGDKYLADSLIKEIDSFVVSRKPIKLIYQNLNSLENLVRKYYKTNKSSNRDSLELGIKSVAYLKQFITFRAIPPEKVFYRDEFYRDSCMAENIQTAIAGNERVLIFTHNTHVRNNYLPKNNMGYFLRKTYGSDYYALGILVFEGEYLSAQYNQTLRKVEFNRFQIKSLKGSAESLLNQPGKKFYFLDFKNLEESDPFKILLTRKNLTYNSNGGYIINSFRGKNVYAKGILPELFDGIFFIKESTPIHLID